MAGQLTLSIVLQIKQDPTVGSYIENCLKTGEYTKIVNKVHLKVNITSNLLKLKHLVAILVDNNDMKSTAEYNTLGNVAYSSVSVGNVVNRKRGIIPKAPA